MARCPSPAVYANTQDSEAGWNRPDGFGLASERRQPPSDHAEPHTGTRTVSKACSPQPLTWLDLEKGGHLGIPGEARDKPSPPSGGRCSGWVTSNEACFFLSAIPPKCNGLCRLTPQSPLVSVLQAGLATVLGLAVGLSRAGLAFPCPLLQQCTLTHSRWSRLPTAVGMWF